MSDEAARQRNGFGKDRLPGARDPQLQCGSCHRQELKANFLGTAAVGDIIFGEATPAHLGRTTQVWDATVSSEKTGKTIALFRCTQLILW